MSIFTPQAIGQNSLTLEEGSHVVILTIHGQQTVKFLEDMLAGMKEKFLFLRQSGMPTKALIDLADVKRMTSAERGVVIRAMTTLDYDKCAISGGPVFAAVVAKFMILISGKQGKLAYFKTEPEARSWLEE